MGRSGGVACEKGKLSQTIAMQDACGAMNLGKGGISPWIIEHPSTGVKRRASRGVIRMSALFSYPSSMQIRVKGPISVVSRPGKAAHLSIQPARCAPRERNPRKPKGIANHLDHSGIALQQIVCPLIINQCTLFSIRNERAECLGII